jgi:hypothetical protein
MMATRRSERTRHSAWLKQAPTARTSEEAVRRATGCGRGEWFRLLDRWGAVERDHGAIARWIIKEHGVDNWWAQTLTVDYEQARGLRPRGGRRDGTFAASASKTVGVPVGRLFKAFLDSNARRRWLSGAVLRERTRQPGRSARFNVNDDGTRLAVGFTVKGQTKSQVALLHDRLPNARAARRARAFWGERLAALKALLEGGDTEHP